MHYSDQLLVASRVSVMQCLITCGLQCFDAVGWWQEGHPTCKKLSGGCCIVICLARGAHLHMVQLMPLPLAVSCFSKIQIGFTFLVPGHPDSPGQSAVKRVCVCVLLTTIMIVSEQ